MTVKVDAAIAVYLKLREQKAQIEKAAKAEVEKLERDMDKLTSWLSKLDELKTETFTLNDLITEAISHMRSIYSQVRFSVDEARATIEVVADRQKIKQVIDNVLTNALEAVAGKDGEITVSLAQEGEEVEVRIRDNGIGISGEELERIAKEEFSSKDLGTGLGLVIARRFLELHRGSLAIHSSADEGTTIVMRFAKHVQQT